MYVCSRIFYPLSTYYSIAFNLLRGSWKCWSRATFSLGITSWVFYRSTTTKTVLGIWLVNLKYLKSVSKLMRKTLETYVLPKVIKVLWPSSLMATSINSFYSRSCYSMISPLSNIWKMRTLILSICVFGGFHLKV